MPFTVSTDIKIYYEAAGEGQHVLYISGTGGDLRAKPNVFDGPLPKAMSMVAYDQRGLGQTEKPDENFTMAQYADDAAALMDELGWQSAHVIGVSFGGMVAQHFALRHPDRIKKLVLCCTSPGGKMPSYPLHENSPEMDPKEKFKKMFGVNDTRLDAAWQAENAERVERIMQATLDSAHEDQKTDEFKRSGRRQLEARAKHDVLARLSEIKMPTLICAGKYDGIAPPVNQTEMEQRIPNAQLNWYEGGHMFMVQDKSAWPAIIDFLKA